MDQTQTNKFQCPYCDYVGMNGLMHVRNDHKDKYDDWMAENRRQQREEERAEAERQIEEPKHTERTILEGFRLLELNNRFLHHDVRPEAIDTMRRIRSRLAHIANMIAHEVPDGRERAFAFTKLEEAMFWANEGIARAFPADIGAPPTDDYATGEDNLVPEGT